MASFALQPRFDKKSFNLLWKVVPVVLPFLLFAYRHAERAASERDTARRQETTYGSILDCGYGGKGGKYCHYSFQTSDEQPYVGASLVSSDVGMGQTVSVYYDAQNPRANALESFSIKSRDDQKWFYIYLLIPVASIGVGLYAKAKSPSNRKAP